ncbi:unnamed protein product, partial [Iphiclides podalirius]
MGNGFVMIVSDVGGSSRFVSGDMALVHRFSSCFFPSQWLFTPPRRRSDGPFATSICARYRRMTDASGGAKRERRANASRPRRHNHYQLIPWKLMERRVTAILACSSVSLF